MRNIHRPSTVLNPSIITAAILSLPVPATAVFAISQREDMAQEVQIKVCVTVALEASGKPVTHTAAARPVRSMDSPICHADVRVPKVDEGSEYATPASTRNPCALPYSHFAHAAIVIPRKVHVVEYSITVSVVDAVDVDLPGAVRDRHADAFDDLSDSSISTAKASAPSLAPSDPDSSSASFPIATWMHIR